MKFLLLILLIAACASPPPKPSEKVLAFLTERAEAQKDPEAEEAPAPPIDKIYADYLAGVENLFTQNSLPFKFDGYLNSLRNEEQLLAHMNFTLEGRFRKETGLRAERNPREYITYKARTIEWQRKKFEEQRLGKLLTELGSDLYSKLQSYHSDFHKAHKPNPPLPL